MALAIVTCTTTTTAIIGGSSLVRTTPWAATAAAPFRIPVHGHIICGEKVRYQAKLRLRIQNLVGNASRTLHCTTAPDNPSITAVFSGDSDVVLPSSSDAGGLLSTATLLHPLAPQEGALRILTWQQILVQSLRIQAAPWIRAASTLLATTARCIPERCSQHQEVQGGLLLLPLLLQRLNIPLLLPLLYMRLWL